MSTMFTVEARVVGQKRPIFSDWQIEVPPVIENNGHPMKLRDLISSIVIKEVDGFKSRQQERRLARVMSQQQIASSAEQGKINPGERDLVQEVNIEESIVVALQAFTDGLYFVFIDEVQQTELDREVFLKADSNVMFLRLTALAGG